MIVSADRLVQIMPGPQQTKTEAFAPELKRLLHKMALNIYINQVIFKSFGHTTGQFIISGCKKTQHLKDKKLTSTYPI